MDLDLIIGLRGHLRVVSHTPGKLKLKVGLGVINNPKVIEYVKVNGFGPPKGQKTPGVRKTSFNPFTRSMTMQYDKTVIQPELLHRLFTSESADDVRRTAVTLAETVNFDLAGLCQ